MESVCSGTSKRKNRLVADCREHQRGNHCSYLGLRKISSGFHHSLVVFSFPDLLSLPACECYPLIYTLLPLISPSLPKGASSIARTVGNACPAQCGRTQTCMWGHQLSQGHQTPAGAAWVLVLARMEPVPPGAGAGAQPAQSSLLSPCSAAGPVSVLLS